jgi:glycosyltransferase involved in cell wall biosynthesis
MPKNQTMPKVSIVIPAYNEEGSIGKLLEVILAVDLSKVGFDREILVIDNGSHDKTSAIASKFKGVTVLRIEVNRGKGEGTKFGIANASGDWVLIQDADLEYDPHDYPKLLAEIKKADGLVTVYGSRLLGQWHKKKSIFPGKHPTQAIPNWVAGLVLTFWTWLLYGRIITDTLTAYKVYPMKLLKTFHIQTFGFETDHELTAKLIRSGAKVIEVPIAYHPRSVEQGKKIKASDFFIALKTLWKYRFVSKSQF